MVIRILDHVDHCSTYADGDVIFGLIAPQLESGQDVVLSFDGVDAVPSAFVNAAFVRLAEVLNVAEVQKHLKIVQSTRQINELIRSRFHYLNSLSSNELPAAL